MATKIWHNTDYESVQDSILNSETISIPLRSLTLVAASHSDNLDTALNSRTPGSQLRETGVGDVLQTREGQFWLVAQEDFQPLIPDQAALKLTVSNTERSVRRTL